MSPEQIQARIKVLCAYLEGFVALTLKSEGIKLEINVPESATNICALYERYAEEIVRPTIDSTRIQHFKIIANTELSTLRVSPISYPESLEQQNKLNAKLAFHIALSFLIDWNSLDSNKALMVLSEDTELRTFVEEHLQWLIVLDSRYLFPIFSNSQVWRLFFYLLRDRINASL